jgi:N-glycosyltransferase
VVALGDDDAVASWSGPRPANVHLTGVVQQRALLPRCDLFVTHAGFGSIREALSAGIPMVSLPLNAEQPANAARLAELGIAVSLDAATANVETIAQACREVLDVPRYRDAAREWQRRTRALPDADVMVRELEAIAAAGDADHAR